MDDIRLYAVEQGEGEPLVLLHGNGEDHTYFQNQIAPFSRFFHVIAPDTRGHGRSPRGEKPFSLETFADDLNGCLEERNIPAANLLGFSDGGNIALLFAMKYPQKVKKLVLNGANLTPKGVKSSVQLPILAGYVTTSLLAHFSRRAKMKHEMLGLMTTQPHISPEQLKSIEHPALVITGDRDMIKPAHSRMIAGALPQGAFCEIPGSHFIAAENSLQFNQEVLAFLLASSEK